MSVYTIFEMCTCTISPKHIGADPFFATGRNSGDKELPSLSSAIYNFTVCTRRALNTRIIGFGDPTLQQCATTFVNEVKANKRIGWDECAVKTVLDQQRGAVDINLLPWHSRPEYIDWLTAQNRLSQ